MIKPAKFTAYNISARTKTLALQDDGSRNSLATLLTRLKHPSLVFCDRKKYQTGKAPSIRKKHVGSHTDLLMCMPKLRDGEKGMLGLIDLLAIGETGNVLSFKLCRKPP